MRSILLFFLLLTTQFSFAQDKRELRLQAAIQQLDSALIHSDTATLSGLFLPQFTFGHSNAMVQTKAIALTEAASGKLRYNRIEAVEKPTFTLVKNVGSVRRKIAVVGVLGSTPFNMKLSVLEVWLYQRKSWKLLSRQSAKLPEQP